MSVVNSTRIVLCAALLGACGSADGDAMSDSSSGSPAADTTATGSAPTSTNASSSDAPGNGGELITEVAGPDECDSSFNPVEIVELENGELGLVCPDFPGFTYKIDRPSAGCCIQ